jgi:hypothetical protein
MGWTVGTKRFSGYLNSSYTKPAEITLICGEHEHNIYIFQQGIG